MNFATTFAAVTAVMALLMAILAWSLSRIPGWHGLRWFSGLSIGALCFALGNCVATLPVSDAAVIRGGQVALWGASLFVLSCPAFCARLERRGIGRVDKAFMTLAVVSAVLVAVPGVVLGDGVEHRLVDAGWFGAIAYRQPVNGPLGVLLHFCFGACTAWYALELLVASRSSRRGLAGHGLAMLLVALGVFNDALVSRGVIEGSYVVLVALQAMVIASGTMISRRVGQGARELERLTRELESTEAALVRRERLATLGAVAAGVSHQVRAPLAILECAVGTLQAQLGADADTGELLSIASEESGRIGRIVSELSDFASPRPPSFSEHALDEVIINAVRAALLGARLPEEAVQLRLENEGRTLVCDAGLLHQSLVNLVNNALQARGRKGPVQLHAHWEGAPSRAVIDVRDDGVGLAPELHGQIFEPFFTTRATGAGLGLSLVKRVAEAHGGRIGVLSAPGAGACFTLTLPAGSRPPREASGGAAVRHRPHG